MKGKAQSAMEFLMTYGWAILIMLVVVAVLFMLGVFNPQTAAPNSCILPAGFSCYGYAVTEGGNFSLDIGQATGGDVRIIRIACTGEETPFDDGRWVYPDEVIQSGKHKGITADDPLLCWKEGDVDTSTLVAGDFYRGTIYIDYNETRTGIVHKIKGDIGYKVESSA